MESFLPENRQKYLFDNFKLGPTYRSYNDNVPQFLQGRPRKVIVHCLQRITKASKFLQSDVSAHKSDTTHEVYSHASGKIHTVDVKQPHCSCKDWLRYNMPCKHMFAVFKHCSECSWDSLPETYKQSEYLSADFAMLGDVSCHRLVTNAHSPTEIENTPMEIENSSNESHTAAETSPELATVHREEANCTSEIPTKVTQVVHVAIAYSTLQLY